LPGKEKDVKKNVLSEDEVLAPRRCTAGEVELIAPTAIGPKRSGGRVRFEQDAIVRLADSIRRYGLLQPLSVRLLGGEGKERRYELISGERRLRACRLLGLTRVPCLVSETDPRRSAELALLENVQREQLDIFEQAEAILSLMEGEGMTQEQAARLLSVSQSYVGNKLRLLRLSEEEREVVRAAHLSERHVRALLRVSDGGERLSLLRAAAAGGLTVSKTEELVDKHLEMLHLQTLHPEPVHPETLHQTEQTAAVAGGEQISAAEETADERETAGVHKLVLKDLRLFYNTIDRAAAFLQAAGASVSVEKHEDESGYEVRVHIGRRC